MIVILPEDAQRHLQAQRGKGLHYFSCCSVCGSLAWSRSVLTEPDQVVVEERVGQCHTCQEISRRHPDLFNWILNVIAYREFTNDEEEEED